MTTLPITTTLTEAADAVDAYTASIQAAASDAPRVDLTALAQRLGLLTPAGQLNPARVAELLALVAVQVDGHLADHVENRWWPAG